MVDRNDRWYEGSFRRNLVDMHVEDWDEVFLSRFDARSYFDCLKAGHTKSAMIYLQSHVGLCNWPTESGRMHPGFHGQNKIKQLVDLCNSNGMDVVGYYSLIFNNWAYAAHPEWRMKDVAGNPSRHEKALGIWIIGGRYGLVCPNNSEYRAFIFRQFAEMLATYEMKGMFLDMTYWPMVCYCDSCKGRFKKETGEDLPESIDWHDPLWLRFKDARERWLNEFAHMCTAELKRLQPGISIEHNFGNLHYPWVFGVSNGFSTASDYAGGDLYGGSQQQSFICKLFRECTSNQPFEYMTVTNSDFTTAKPEDALRLHNFLSLAHHGAMLFIDRIHSDGTMNPRLYRTIGKVFSESMPYEKYLTGNLVADTAIYFHLPSKLNPRAKTDLREQSNVQIDATLGASIALNEGRFLHTAIPSDKQDRIRGKKVVIVTEAAMLSDTEIDVFADYVGKGGGLYISGNTNIKLAEKLLGLKSTGYRKERITFVSPTKEGDLYFKALYSRENPMEYHGVQMTVLNPLGKTVIATITLPYTDPDDKTVFADIHSNPPGIPTDIPSIVYGAYGDGKVVWSATSFEKSPVRAHREVFLQLVELLHGGSSMLSSTAPLSVQFTLFDDEGRECMFLNAVNVQERYPVIGTGGFRVKIKTPKRVHSVQVLPDESEVEFSHDEDALTFDIPDLGIFRMYRLCYGS